MSREIVTSGYESQENIRHAAYLAIVRITGEPKEQKTLEDIEVLFCRIKWPGEESDNEPGNTKAIRRLLTDSGFSVWTIPGGGIQENELAETALARELFQELGLRIDPQTHEIRELEKRETSNNLEGTSQHSTLFLIEYREDMGVPIPGEEMDAVRWMNLHTATEEVKNLDALLALFFVLRAYSPKYGEITPEIVRKLGVPIELLKLDVPIEFL